MTTTKQFIIFGREGGHPNYKANVEKPVKGINVDATCRCVYCGKFVKSEKFFVFLSNDAQVITKEQGNGIDDLGLYPVGSDCAKLAKNAGHKLYDGSCNEI